VSEIVFILGAGASREAGAPLVSDFIEKARALRRAGRVRQFEAEFDCVLDAISKLQAVHSKSELALDNIESVFAAFEMGALIDKLPGVSGDEKQRRLLAAFRRVITVTLEESVTFPTHGQVAVADKAYKKFGMLVKTLNGDGSQGRCSIITFNYDVALDYALWAVGVSVDYCLRGTRQTESTPLLKLHGSLNWARCSKCHGIIAWNVDDYIKQYRPITWERDGRIPLYMASELPHSSLTCCNGGIIPDPVIVPPTWDKTRYHEALSPVWRRAALELESAESVFVSGYSLTESDSFFRYLFSLGTVGDTIIERFWVFDPDEQGLVRKRFERLIGPAVRARFRFENKTFAEACGVVERALRSKD